MEPYFRKGGRLSATRGMGICYGKEALILDRYPIFNEVLFCAYYHVESNLQL